MKLSGHAIELRINAEDPFADFRPTPGQVEAFDFPEEVPDDATLRIEFDEPCFGVAPGQAAVCYDGDRVVVGGWIQETG